MANQYLALGLFIMLLSFFLVLNSMSTFEEGKSQAVIESLNETFLPERNAVDLLKGQEITDPDESFRSGDALDDVKALLESLIPDAKAKKNRFGTVMTVQLPRDRFLKAMQGKSSKANSRFRDRFSKILVGMISFKSGEPYQVDILINTPQNPATYQEKSPEQAAHDIKEAASFAEILEKDGLDRKLVTAGLSNGPSNTVTLVFEHYSPLHMEAVK